ncbi:histone-lysine N-methyltransferase SMYD3-like [Varroa destructor]|uniref:MYND-type domain-containing protein n=1 Tax=Varroa destructor TaxID=109461 RepID=A0A7M7KZU3_VARDE|nr:histone-lysine N-methyltransferase SMYD3-like [Varroa destructor]
MLLYVRKNALRDFGLAKFSGRRNSLLNLPYLVNFQILNQVGKTVTVMEGSPALHRVYKPGDIMIEEEPYACAVDTQYLASVCSYCIRRESSVRCPLCNSLSYCSIECKNKDVLYHNLECKVLQAVRAAGGHSIDGEMRLVVRALDRSIRERDSKKLSVGDYFGHKRTFDDLMQHLDKLSPNELTNSKGLSHTLFLLTKDHVQTTPEEILTIMDKCRINCHALVDHNSPHAFVRGRVVYLGVSKMNHSCVDVSYVQVFDGRKYTLRALTEIEVTNPLSLTIHYVPPTLPFKTRRRRLLKNYHFVCECPKCKLQNQQPNVPEADERLVTRIEAAFQNRYPYSRWYTMGHEFLNLLKALPETNFYVNWVLSQMQWSCKELGHHEESIFYGTRALLGSISVLSLERIFYTMCESMVMLGWTQPEHKNHTTFLTTRQFTKELYKLTHGMNHSIMRSLDIMIDATEFEQKSPEVETTLSANWYRSLPTPFLRFAKMLEEQIKNSAMGKIRGGGAETCLPYGRSKYASAYQRPYGQSWPVTQRTRPHHLHCMSSIRKMPP